MGSLAEVSERLLLLVSCIVRGPSPQPPVSRGLALGPLQRTGTQPEV